MGPELVSRAHLRKTHVSKYFPRHEFKCENFKFHLAFRFCKIHAPRIIFGLDHASGTNSLPPSMKSPTPLPKVILDQPFSFKNLAAPAISCTAPGQSRSDM